jgi:hypothetical protein
MKCVICDDTKYCNILVGSIHDGTLLHSKPNTQPLITISSSSRILIHVRQILELQRMRPLSCSFPSGPLLIAILLWKRLRLHSCTTTTDPLLRLLFGLLLEACLIVALLRKCNNFALSTVTATLTLLGQGNLTYATPPRKPNM